VDHKNPDLDTNFPIFDLGKDYVLVTSIVLGESAPSVVKLSMNSKKHAHP
jgi:hypothetical protein